jgi:hypothetical protein
VSKADLPKGALMPHGHADLGELTPQSVFYDQGRFGRLFPTLPPFAADTPPVRDALGELGAPGGPMDPGDDLSDPITLVTDPAKRARNPDNPAVTAGFTFLGQFLDHDMTFDPTSSLARRQDPEAIRNFRIPALDLDSVYGGGPVASPQQYDQAVDGGRTTLLVEEIPGSAGMSIDGATRHDLPRNSQHVALVGDPRNDENLIVSQLQLAFLRFHNRVVADVTADLGPGSTAGEIFAEAQRVVRWHYQWLILHEFLPTTVGQAMVDDVLAAGPKFFKWRNDPFIPVEFSVAAYRFGHSQVRPNKKIDTTLSTVLFHLLGQPRGEPTSLATRNLLRNLTMKVPSGQRVAQAMQLPELAPGDLEDLKPFDLHRRTPLWFYVLREAEATAGGEHLGPVGGRIVAEVIVGLISGDRQSYLRQDPGWTPTYGSADSFTMVDLLTAAGAVATIA